jgi:heptaprenyl diphosphate synthase
MKSNFNLTKRTAIDGIRAAVALTLAFLESLIPDIALLPPGAKLGLSNIAVMFAVLTVGYIDGLFITVIKSGFVFFTRGLSSFFMSISGGVLSCLILILIIHIQKKTKKEFSFTGISVICAVVHNIGQTVTASIYMSTNLLTGYLPLLILLGIPAGLVTGVILRTVIPAISNITHNIRG